MTVATAVGFRAVLRTELLRNARRPAPYVMIALFVGNALLWWARGPAGAFGWATNSDFYIARLFSGFSFLTLPLCTAVMMGDPVIRDFTQRLDPLLFSKPLGRAGYVAGKFLGSFLVLVACQAAFALALSALQAFRPTGMLVGPPRVLPYVQHFLTFVVVSHLALAALHFGVGTLTRSTRAVYGLAVGFYPLYAAYAIQLKALPARWRVALDPLLLNWYGEVSRGRNAAWLNALVVQYDRDLLLNRAIVACLALACLAFVVVRFDACRERSLRGAGGTGGLAVLGLAPAGSRPVARALRDPRAEPGLGLGAPAAALGVEVRLLRADQSLMVTLPLAVGLVLLGPLVYGVRGVAPGAGAGEISAAYAAAGANAVLFLLLGLIAFYTGEAMHRDREARVEPLLWSTPAPDATFLLAPFAASVLLALALLTCVALGTALLQVARGDAPLDLLVYARAYVVLLAPTAVTWAALVVLLNVVIRDKYATHLACVGLVSALFFLLSQGHTHWSYNLALYGRWTPADLSAHDGRWPALLAHRLYCLALGAAWLALAHLRFARPGPSDASLARRRGRLGVLALSAAVAGAAALLVARLHV